MRESVELFVRSVHLIAAIVWVGGVIFFTFLAMPILQRSLPPQTLIAIYNRFRGWVRLMIHVLLTTGAMLFFIVAWNNGFFAGNGNADFGTYMLTFIAKLAAFGVMALAWGLYSSRYRQQLETPPLGDKTEFPANPYTNMWGGLLLAAGLIVFALALLLRS